MLYKFLLLTLRIDPHPIDWIVERGCGIRLDEPVQSSSRLIVFKVF